MDVKYVLDLQEVRQNVSRETLNKWHFSRFIYNHETYRDMAKL